MLKNLVYRSLSFCVLLSSLASCSLQKNAIKIENKSVPQTFNGTSDTTNLAKVNWAAYFNDPYLVAYIDTALRRNQELNIMTQEIEIARNEVRARRGEYLPFVGLRGAAGVEKVGDYTRNGAVEENLNIKSDTPFPKPLPDYMLGAYASWEIDVWKKLRNAKRSASMRYLATIEGRNFMVTNLIAEIADSYYELMMLDNQQGILQQNIQIQTDALHIVKQQKEATKVTQLAVNRFEALLLNTKSRQYEIQQRITETENHLRFLTGGLSKTVPRNSASFTSIPMDSVFVGIPSQLLANRPDIREAELQLAASKLDIAVARANFYPSVRITGGVGFQSFKPTFLISPESLLFNLAGDLVAPLINRNALHAAYNSATAKQVQHVYNYERTILNAYVDVVNQLNKAQNYTQSFTTKTQEVDILTQSIVISNNLFRSARADYLEVLLTQREALESKMDLIELKMMQLNAKVNIYKALGGGWR